MKNKDGSTTTDLEETEKECSNKVYLCPHITSQALVSHWGFSWSSRDKQLLCLFFSSFLHTSWSNLTLRKVVCREKWWFCSWICSPVQQGLTQWKGQPEVRMGRPDAGRERGMVVATQPVKAMNEQSSLGESDWSFSGGLPSASLLLSQLCYDYSLRMDICGEIYLLMSLCFLHVPLSISSEN